MTKAADVLEQRQQAAIDAIVAETGLAVARSLETGMVHINDSSVNDEPHVPFGGVKNSGVGWHDGQGSIDSFTEMRWITLERGGRHYPPPFYEIPNE